MRGVCACVLAGCATAPARPVPTNRTEPAACQAAREHTRVAMTHAKLTADEQMIVAPQFDACWSGWSIALDGLCRIAPETYDNTDEQVTILGRFVFMHDAATFTPIVGGVGTGCDGLGETNIASADFTHLVTLVTPPRLDDLDCDGSAELIVKAPRRAHQDHPEQEGISLYEDQWDYVLALRDGAIVQLDRSHLPHCP